MRAVIREKLFRAHEFQQQAAAAPQPVAAQPVAIQGERYLTVGEIAAKWQMNRHTVQALFEHEKGVVAFGNTETTQEKRRRVVLRIPVSVFRRVEARMTVRLAIMAARLDTNPAEARA